MPKFTRIMNGKVETALADGSAAARLLRLGWTEDMPVKPKGRKAKKNVDKAQDN